jgi:G:T-mismatch repair DNA endonuclease (very short patch repair protein)
MALGAFNKALGLNAEVKKGYFPHFFNIPENQSYVGPYPEKKYYGYATMKPGARKSFDAWYATTSGKTFDFQKEIIEYCKDDVKVLRVGCLKFRQDHITMLKKHNKPLQDPFDNATSAALAMNTYNTSFQEIPLPMEKIPRNFNQSKEAYGYLKWIEHFYNIPDMLTFETGEKIIKYKGQSYPVDGYSNTTKTIFQYHGCYYHGHKRCMQNIRHTDTKEFYRQKQARERTLRVDTALQKWCAENGFRYSVIYGCVWKEQIEANPKIKNFLRQLKTPIIKNISPREGYSGGRTNAVKLYYKAQKDEQIYYMDYTSLYPYIYSFIAVPTQHCVRRYDVDPVQFTKDYYATKELLGFGKAHKYNDTETINEMILKAYETGHSDKIPLGSFKVEFTPPKHLIHSLIGAKTVIDGEEKLVFDNTRKIHTIPSPELFRLLDLGGTIHKIHGTFTSPSVTNEAFTEFVQSFFRLKALNAGLKDIGGEKNLEQYIADFNSRYKTVSIKKEDFYRDENGKICENSAFKLLSKLLINSFYGKFGQDNDKYSETINCPDPRKVSMIINDPKYEPSSVVVIEDDEDHTVFSIKRKQGQARVSKYQNCLIASLITSFARSKLYDLLYFLDGDCKNIEESKVLYFDTDSVIFRGTKDLAHQVEEKFECGSLLGQLTHEFSQDLICKEYVSLGPKTYGLKLEDKETGAISFISKAKGFTQNFENSKAINFQSMKSLAFSYVNLAQKLDVPLSEAQTTLHQIYDLVDDATTTNKTINLEKFPKEMKESIQEVIQHKQTFMNELEAIHSRHKGTEYMACNELLATHELKNKYNSKTQDHIVKILFVVSSLFKKDIVSCEIHSTVMSKVFRSKYNKRRICSHQTNEDGEIFALNTIPYGFLQ